MTQLFSDIKDQTLSRIIIVDNIEEFTTGKIENGILSIHAKWSGQSIMHGKSILKLFDNSESRDFDIYIIDIDTIGLEKQIELIGTGYHGYFESVWIENGKIEFNYRDNSRSTELLEFKKFLNKKIYSEERTRTCQKTQI